MNAQPAAAGSRREGGSSGRAEAAAVVLVACAATVVLSAAVGAEPLAAAVSVAASAIIPAAAGWSVLRRRPQRVSPADRVTITRVAMTGFLSGALVLVAADELAARTWLVLAVAAVAAVLDAVDGWVARRT